MQIFVKNWSKLSIFIDFRRFWPPVPDYWEKSWFFDKNSTKSDQKSSKLIKIDQKSLIFVKNWSKIVKIIEFWSKNMKIIDFWSIFNQISTKVHPRVKRAPVWGCVREANTTLGCAREARTTSSRAARRGRVEGRSRFQLGRFFFVPRSRGSTL